MTDKEAIEILKDLWRYKDSKFSEKEIREALDKAIEAIKNQKSVIEELEKIKEEVEILPNNNPSSNPILWASYDLIDREEVLDFINKRIFDLKGE